MNPEPLFSFVILRAAQRNRGTQAPKAKSIRRTLSDDRSRDRFALSRAAGSPDLRRWRGLSEDDESPFQTSQTFQTLFFPDRAHARIR